MSELSTEENEKLVARIYEKAMNSLLNNEPITAAQRVVHDVEHMMQEVNSGASYEQYFRWASIDEVQSISRHLRMLIPYEELRLLNPELRRDATPPGESGLSSQSSGRDQHQSG